MAANTNPIFTSVPKNSWCKVTAADGSTDGTDADVQLLFTSNATDGSYVDRIICHPISTSGSTTTSAAAIRVYINNGSAVGTAGNNLLFKQITAAAISVNVTATAGVTDYEIPLNFQLQAGYRLYIGVTAMAANTQWNCLCISGDYS